MDCHDDDHICHHDYHDEASFPKDRSTYYYSLFECCRLSCVDSFCFLLDTHVRFSSKISDWSFLIGTAVVLHGIATLIWNNNIRHVNASKASILSNLEPFVAMVMGLILLYKPITGAEIIGSLFIVGE